MIFQNVVKLSFHYFQPSCLIYKVKNYLQEKFGVHSIRESHEELTAAIYFMQSWIMRESKNLWRRVMVVCVQR